MTTSDPSGPHDGAFERTVADRERTSSDSTHPVSSPVPVFGSAGLPDRYEVIRTLGAGATGRVLAARDHTFDREVAVKMLLGADGMATARFHPADNASYNQVRDYVATFEKAVRQVESK